MRNEMLQQLEAWFQSPLGQAVRQQTAARLQDILPRIYYPVSVQLGSPGINFLGQNENSRCIYINTHSDKSNGELNVNSRFHQLPLPARSVDLMVLPHVLEFTRKPHRILREVNQVIAPEGHIVIVGFSPISLWGVRRFIFPWRKKVPWSGRFYSLARIQDWLSLLDFELRAGSMLCYRPPIRSQRIAQQLLFLEKAGERWWPMFGGVYVLIARKREANARLVQSVKRARPKFAPSLVRPAASSRHERNHDIH